MKTGPIFYSKFKYENLMNPPISQAVFLVYHSIFPILLFFFKISQFFNLTDQTNLFLVFMKKTAQFSAFF
jgi:hypothetical protein